MNREALFTALNVISPGPDLNAITDQAYNLVADQEWRTNRDSPHGHPWHTSFHGSQFPGSSSDEKRCGRQALYTMMSIPKSAPANVKLVATGNAGSAIEKSIIYRWAKLGILLGPDGKVEAPDKEWKFIKQLGLEDPDTWLTGALDAVLDVRPRWEEALPVDLKSKPLSLVEEMRIGLKFYDPDHYKQLQAYLFLVHRNWDALPYGDMGLLPPSGGIILYVARDNPAIRKQFFIPMDLGYIAEGLARLHAWQEFYKEDRLPARPKDWKWTELPCKWCDFKRNCKADYKDGITALTDSHTVEFAKTIDKDYNADQVREEVLKRWTSPQLPPS